MYLKCKFIVVLFLTTLCSSGFLSASPIFSIGEGSAISWNQAILNGNVQAAANPLSGNAAAQFYNTQIGINGVTNIVAANDTNVAAAGLVSDGAESHDSLVMSWDVDNQFSQTDLVVSAWDYVYDVDPDLTGTKVHFSAYAPLGVWDLSLELIDVFGNTRGWFQGNPASTWQNYWIDPNVAAAQGPFGFFHNDALFDITQVVVIRLNESSMGGTNFTNIDPITGLTNPWNAWNHLSVAYVPLPAAIWLFGAGLLGLIAVARRRV